MESAFPFKIAIFDLDFTLWDGKMLYKDVFEILYCLQQSNIKMYIVSYNSHAKDVCKSLGIVEFFHDIYNQRNVPKSYLINHIAKLNKIYISKSNIFFDDDMKNIDDVTKYGCATAVLVKKGLKWRHIPSLPLAIPLAVPLNSRMQFIPFTTKLPIDTILEETIIEVTDDTDNNDKTLTNLSEQLEVLDDDEMYMTNIYTDIIHENNIYESKLLE